MRDPFHPEREMLSREDAAKQRAELDQRWEEISTKLEAAQTVDEKLALTDEMNRIQIDELFAPWEVSCPFLANYIRSR